MDSFTARIYFLVLRIVAEAHHFLFKYPVPRQPHLGRAVWLKGQNGNLLPAPVPFAALIALTYLHMKPSKI